MVHQAMLLGVLVAVAGCGQATFACMTDSECVSDGFEGMCQPSGYCSFGDPQCDSGQRYGSHAPSSLASQCVPPEGSLTASTEPIDPGESTNDPAGPGMTSIAEESSSTSGIVRDVADESGEDTGTPVCCDASCPGACADACEPVQIGGPSGAEAIGVAIVGDHVVWSTGYGKTLRIADPDGGPMDAEFVPLSQNNFVTRIAADDTHVYVLDYGGATVKRVSVPDGAVDLVTTVAEGQAEFGGIAVGEEHVYFAMRTSGGIWRAAKDLSQVEAAEEVAIAVAPNDVALDATHVYWIDNDVGEIRRLAFADIGADVMAERIVTGVGLETLVVDDARVYYADGGTVSSAIKDGDNEGMIELATERGTVFDMAVDSTHLYWTGWTSNQVVGVPKDGSAQAEVIASSPTPWGLALGCDALYWAENGTGTLRKRSK
jgi:hypothetical protein